jgi:hypothetical protein
MKPEHLDYLEANIANYNMAQSGYIRNLDLELLQMYEHIYRANIDPSFVLTKWCSSCVMDLIKRLYAYYLSLPQEQVQQLTQSVEIIIKKRGRPKK